MFEPDELLRTLTHAQVDFVAIGGVAVGIHGFVRATKDLDIVPDPAPENIARLARVLADIEARHVGIGDFAPEEFPCNPTDPDQLAEGANFRLDTAHGPLDILQWVAGIDGDLAYHELTSQAITVKFRYTKIRVCSLNHLRTMKHAAGRPQDLEDLKHLDGA